MHDPQIVRCLNKYAALLRPCAGWRGAHQASAADTRPLAQKCGDGGGQNHDDFRRDFFDLLRFREGRTGAGCTASGAAGAGTAIGTGARTGAAFPFLLSINASSRPTSSRTIRRDMAAPATQPAKIPSGKSNKPISSAL